MKNEIKKALAHNGGKCIGKKKRDVYDKKKEKVKFRDAENERVKKKKRKLSFDNRYK